MVTGRCLSVSFVVGLLNTEYTVFGFRKVNITAGTDHISRRFPQHIHSPNIRYSRQYGADRSTVPILGGTMDNRPNPIRGPSTCKTDDTMEVTNPAEFLRNERGVFEVISPYGHVFSVTCRFGSRMNVREISEPKSIENQQRLTWKIRRVNSNVA